MWEEKREEREEAKWKELAQNKSIDRLFVLSLPTKESTDLSLSFPPHTANFYNHISLLFHSLSLVLIWRWLKWPSHSVRISIHREETDLQKCVQNSLPLSLFISLPLSPFLSLSLPFLSLSLSIFWIQRDKRETKPPAHTQTNLWLAFHYSFNFVSPHSDPDVPWASNTSWLISWHFIKTDGNHVKIFQAKNVKNGYNFFHSPIQLLLKVVVVSKRSGFNFVHYFWSLKVSCQMMFQWNQLMRSLGTEILQLTTNDWRCPNFELHSQIVNRSYDNDLYHRHHLWKFLKHKLWNTKIWLQISVTKVLSWNREQVPVSFWYDDIGNDRDINGRFSHW